MSEPATKAAASSPSLSIKDWRTLLGLIVVIGIIVAIQMSLPDGVTVGPTDLVPFIELAGIPIVAALAFLASRHDRFIRVAMALFLGLLVAATVMNALLLLYSLLVGTSESGIALLFAGFGVLIINVLSFGMVYWWMDAGGPSSRRQGAASRPDFLFPQQGMTGYDGWQPSLVDYLFTAYTNIIAFSPTDTMPLSHRAKALFTLQSATALLTIVVTLSRAINLIPGGPTVGN